MLSRRAVRQRANRPVDSSPTPLVVDFADEIVRHAGDLVLDVGCGFGRNALYLASRGATVVGLDRDAAALAFVSSQAAHTVVADRLSLQQLDLERDPWPFVANSASAVVCVDFPPVFRLLPSLVTSLRSDGYLLLQTISGHGGNYLELPRVGAIQNALRAGFVFRCFRERRVGPLDSDAAATALVAVKRNLNDNSIT